MKDVSGRIAALSPEQRELLLRKVKSGGSGERHSAPEIGRGQPEDSPAEEFDVVILGGGLAGQTLARQIKRERPAVSILVAEMQRHPVRESAHKVGELTVEIGAHYLSKVLGLESHLLAAQLPKSGLRYFFSHGDNEDVARRVEMGASFFPPVPGFQLDRGRLENFLREKNVDLGVEFWDRAKARRVTRDDEKHYVALERGGRSISVAARWVVDASGRSGLLKRQLGLAREVGHKCDAVWFRLDDIVDIDEWSAAPEWKARISKRASAI